jgi:uncharacterized membrane protein
MIHSNQKEHFYYKLWFWATIILGFIMIVLVPPFHSPDEFNHFYKSYHLADEHYTPDFDSSKAHLGGYIPRSLVTISLPFDTIEQHIKPRIWADSVFKYLKFPLLPADKTFVAFPNTARYAPTAYSPQVFTLFILKKINAPPLWMVYIGRLSTFLAWFGLILIAIRWTPMPYRSILMVLTLLPESLAINATLSADAVTNGLLFLQIALFLQLKTEYKIYSSTQLQNKIWLFAFLVLLTTWHKIVYFPLLFLWVLLEKDIFARTGLKKYIFIGLNLILNLILIKFWSSHLHEWIYPFADLTQNTYRGMRQGYIINPDLQIQYIVNQPITFLKKFIPATFSTYSHTNQSYIATFGWELIRLPSKLAIGFLIIFLSWASLQPIRWTRFETGWMLAIAHSMTSLFLLSMYLHWDGVGGEVTDVYTAKYYFVTYALIILLLGGRLTEWPFLQRKKRQIERFFNLSFVLIWIYFLILVYQRYYGTNFLPNNLT